MDRRTGLVVGLLMLAGVSVVLRADDAPKLTWPEKARKAFAEKQYRDAAQAAGLALSTGKPSDAPSDAERYELLLIKAESLLNLKQWRYASDGFNAAAEVAPDAKLGAVARASALVVKASKIGSYKPQRLEAEAIDVIDPESRKRAIDALYLDQQALVTSKVDKATDAKNLVPLIDTLPAVIDLGSLEFAATGSAPKSKALLVELGTRARELMTDELRRASVRVRALESSANTFESYTFEGRDVVRRGISSPERNDVKQLSTYLKKIEKTARDARRRAIELGFDGVKWEPIIADAADLADRCDVLLDTAW